MLGNTSNVCGRCRKFRSSPAGVCCSVRTVHQTGFSSRASTDIALAIEFMKDVGLIRRKVKCDICSRDMTWSAYPTRSELFRWRCRKGSRGARCRGTASIKHGSWFQKSYLTFLEILLITYGIVSRKSALQIQNDMALCKQTVTDWGMFCRETMLVFLEGCSEKNRWS